MFGSDAGRWVHSQVLDVVIDSFLIVKIQNNETKIMTWKNFLQLRKKKKEVLNMNCIKTLRAR